MDSVLLQQSVRPHHNEHHVGIDSLKAGSGLKAKLGAFSSGANLTWGRSHEVSWGTAFGSAGIMCLCPALVIFAWIAMEEFDGSLFGALFTLPVDGLLQFLSQHGPTASIEAFMGYTAWLTFQAMLYTCLPSKLSTGQLTPAGYLLKYYTNGLLAWVVTHTAFAVAVIYGVIDPAIIANNWPGLLVAVNIYGFLLSAFAWTKAHYWPTHVEDRKFSGSWVYDMYMGIEFNPRFGQYWDFKLFTNGRPGIIAWTLIDLSFTAQQYQVHGSVTNSMIIVNILHAIYVVDFFINEDWYLRTIDICHDHFGFYLAWGSLVWLPTMYTLQTQYLARYPVYLSTPIALLILCTGVGGYIIFRSVNHQKDIVRRTDGDCMIWGKKAEVIRCRYTTSDGKEHKSLLLCSGWWGLSRHANYLGDLILSYSMCAVCGFEHIIPWTYAIFMTILLLHRAQRDEERCLNKYGDSWRAYCAKVRWVLIPGVY